MKTPPLFSFFFLLILAECCYSLVSIDAKSLNVKVTNYESSLPPIKIEEKTYYVETFFQANWYRAVHFCRLIGMQLASIKNKNENDKLVEAIKSAFGKRFSFWTSGNDLAQKGKYFWLSTGADFIFKNWRYGEPSDNNILGDYSGKDERCVELVTDSRSDKEYSLAWNTRACSTEMYVICEKVK